MRGLSPSEVSLGGARKGRNDNLIKCSLYPRHTKYVGVYSFRFSVRSFVRTFVRSYVRSFVFPSQGQSFCVKVYKTSYFEDPLMDFVHIYGMMVDIGLKFLSAPSPPQGDLGNKVTDFEFL